MICKSQDLSHAQVPNLKGGDGTITLTHLLDEQQACGVGRLFAVSTIPPGGSIGVHRHEGDFELYYFLSGHGDVLDNGTPGTVGPGDVMLCRDGDSHGIRNTGDEPLRYLALILYTPK